MKLTYRLAAVAAAALITCSAVGQSPVRPHYRSIHQPTTRPTTRSTAVLSAGAPAAAMATSQYRSPGWLAIDVQPINRQGGYSVRLMRSPHTQTIYRQSRQTRYTTVTASSYGQAMATAQKRNFGWIAISVRPLGLPNTYSVGLRRY